MNVIDAPLVPTVPPAQAISILVRVSKKEFHIRDCLARMRIAAGILDFRLGKFDKGIAT